MKAPPTLLQPPEVRWECPSCNVQDVTYEARPHTRFHSCGAQGGLTVPFVQLDGRELVKNSVRHVVKEREDYLADDIPHRDADGRVVMSVVTEYKDGSSDCTVYAPTSVVRSL
jgi:hypothetical protein